jgi:hypothetical protein
MTPGRVGGCNGARRLGAAPVGCQSMTEFVSSCPLWTGLFLRKSLILIVLMFGTALALSLL